MRFADIPGQHKIKNRLVNLVEDDRLPHALLLQGEQGVGKFALAQALAQYIHCTNRTNGDSCGCCPSCRQHASFNHIDTHFSFPIIKKKTSTTPPISDDFIAEFKSFVEKDPMMNFEGWLEELGAATTLPVMYVTESDSLISKLAFTARTSKYKIVVMWLPERMNEQCANKLLKLIEEPFSDTKFILTSDSPQEVLPTIYSRCQRIDVERFTDNDIATYLMEKYSIDGQDALSIAHNAEGSLSKAILQLNTDSGNEQFFNFFIRLMRSAYSRKVGDLKLWSNEVATLGREQQISFLKYCDRLTRENFVYNLRHKDLVYLNTAEEKFSTKFSPYINERNVQELSRTFNNAITDISGNTNSKMVLFDVAVRTILLIKR